MDVVRQPGAAIGRDIAKGEAVEAELDHFISRRDARCRASEGDRATENLWEVSSRLQQARRAAALRAEWSEYHREQAERHRRTLAALISRHEAEAARLGATNQIGGDAA